MKPQSLISLINFLQALIYSALSVMLPLYLLEKNFKIEDIGLLFAILPIVFLLARTLLASLADVIGTASTFKLHALAAVGSISAYMLPLSFPTFALGKILEGVRQSSFWAVIRTEIYSNSEKGKENHFASLMLGVRYVGDLFGKLLIAVLLVYLSFYNSLLALLILSLALVCLNFQIKNPKIKQKLNLNKSLNQILKKRTWDFWKNSIIISLISVQDALSSSGFVLPIYFSTILNMSYFEIGFALAVYSLFYSLAVLATVKFNISFKLTAILSILLGSVPLIFLSYFDKSTIFLFLAVISAGAGFMGHLFEGVLVRLSKNSKFVSTDIAIAHIPIRIVEFLSLASFGFLIVSFGYSSVFYIGAISIFIFTLGTYFYLKN